jgi:hypothetical protein
MTRVPLDLPAASSKARRLSRSAGATSKTRARTDALILGSSSRLGRRQLAAVAGGLSSRDRDVVASVRTCRLITATQLERLHFKDGSIRTRARRCRGTLQRLVDLGLLRRLERRLGGLHAGSAAYIYALTSAGQRLLQVGGARVRRHDPTIGHVQHTLDVTELYVQLHEHERSGACELLRIETEPDCWRHWTGPGGNREVLRPDLYTVVGVGNDELHWFVELDRATEHQPAIRRKCATYDAYYRSGQEQQKHGVFPRVLWVVPDVARKQSLQQTIAGDKRLTQPLFLVTTWERAAERLVK